jgi:hypothetical protein
LLFVEFFKKVSKHPPHPPFLPQVFVFNTLGGFHPPSILPSGSLLIRNDPAGLLERIPAGGLIQISQALCGILYVGVRFYLTTGAATLYNTQAMEENQYGT